MSNSSRIVKFLAKTNRLRENIVLVEPLGGIRTSSLRAPIRLEPLEVMNECVAKLVARCESMVRGGGGNVDLDVVLRRNEFVCRHQVELLEPKPSAQPPIAVVAGELSQGFVEQWIAASLNLGLN